MSSSSFDSAGARTPRVRITAVFAVLVLAVLAMVTVPGGARADLVKTASWGDLWFLPQLHPTAVAFDQEGHAFAGDWGQARIGRIGSGQEIETAWSTGDSDYPSSEPKNPVDVATDDTGHVYAADPISGKIKKFTGDGEPVASWSPPLTAGSRLQGVTFDDSGVLLVLTDDRVLVYEPDGDLVGAWGGFHTESRLSLPLIESDGAGRVLIAGTELTGETATRSIYRFTLSGTLLSRWQAPAAVTRTPSGRNLVISGIDGYTGLVPRPDGGAWVSYAGNPHLINVISSSGTAAGGIGAPGYTPGTLARDDSGHFWMTRFGEINELSSDGVLLRTFGQDDFPKYTGDLGLGKFSRISDIAFDQEGNVYVYDSDIERSQRFGSAGNFLSFTDGPNAGGWVSSISYLEQSPEGFTIFERVSKVIYRYSDSGERLSAIQLGTEGVIRGAVSDGDGGYYLLTSAPDRVAHVDSDGEPLGSWPAPEAADARGLEINGAGNLLFRSGRNIYEYTAGGALVRTFSLGIESCPDDTYVNDFDLDSAGNVYVRGLVDEWDFVAKLDPTGQITWVEEVKDSFGGGGIAVGPSGDIYLTSDPRIGRYEQTGAGDPVPLSERCQVPVIRQPTIRRMKLVGIRYDRKHRRARVKFHLPEAGTLSVRPGGKVKPRSVNVRGRGFVTLSIRLKPKFQRRVNRGKRIRTGVVFAFEAPGRAKEKTYAVLTFKRAR